MKPKDLKGAAPKGTFVAKDGNGNTIDPGLAIFPILKHYDDGTLCLIGTGFFISDNGIFLTAKHVLMDVIDNEGNQTSPIALIQFLGGQYLIRPILRCTSHEIADISVGIAAPMIQNSTGEPLKNKILRLTPTVSEAGSRVCTYAYPKSVFNRAEIQELHFFPEFFDGVTQDNYPKGRDSVLMPGPCFQTSLYIHGGASGGPVFDDSGKVCGVNSTGFDDDCLSFVTPVYTIENLLLVDVKTPNNTTGQVRVRELIENEFISYEK